VKRILIADDHEVVRSGLRAIVETRSNWIVAAEAPDGERAITLALETRPDIIIADYSMPLVNGLEVSRRVKTLRLRLKC
jgi:YesN/AraC family two-component response regulator